MIRGFTHKVGGGFHEWWGLMGCCVSLEMAKFVASRFLEHTEVRLRKRKTKYLRVKKPTSLKRIYIYYVGVSGDVEGEIVHIYYGGNLFLDDLLLHIYLNFF